MLRGAYSVYTLWGGVEAADWEAQRHCSLVLKAGSQRLFGLDYQLPLLLTSQRSFPWEWAVHGSSDCLQYWLEVVRVLLCDWQHPLLPPHPPKTHGVIWEQRFKRDIRAKIATISILHYRQVGLKMHGRHINSMLTSLILTCNYIHCLHPN